MIDGHVRVAPYETVGYALLAGALLTALVFHAGGSSVQSVARTPRHSYPDGSNYRPESDPYTHVDDATYTPTPEPSAKAVESVAPAVRKATSEGRPVRPSKPSPTYRRPRTPAKHRRAVEIAPSPTADVPPPAITDTADQETFLGRWLDAAVPFLRK